MQIKKIIKVGVVMVLVSGCTGLHKTSDKDYQVIDQQRQLNSDVTFPQLSQEEATPAKAPAKKTRKKNHVQDKDAPNQVNQHEELVDTPAPLSPSY